MNSELISFSPWFRKKNSQTDQAHCSRTAFVLFSLLVSKNSFREDKFRALFWTMFFKIPSLYMKMTLFPDFKHWRKLLENKMLLLNSTWLAFHASPLDIARFITWLTNPTKADLRL